MMEAAIDLAHAHLAAAEDYKYTLSYYGDVKGGPELPRGFHTLRDVGQWAAAKQFPTYLLHVTQWDIASVKDAYGCHERVGSCNLEEALHTGSVPE